LGNGATILINSKLSFRMGRAINRRRRPFFATLAAAAVTATALTVGERAPSQRRRRSVGFMVGQGITFTKCMQHQIANLSGTRSGRPPLNVGAVVNGPNGKDLFDAGGLGEYQDRMLPCLANGHDTYAGSTGAAVATSTTYGRPTNGPRHDCRGDRSGRREHG
jgi:hypothetical protein